MSRTIEYELSFDQSVFLNKAKTMYKIHNNLAPSYLHEMFQMREVNLDSTLSNLSTVAATSGIM